MSYQPYKKIGYGSLNQPSPRNFQKSIDIGEGSVDVLSDIVSETFNTQEPMRGPYQGLVLRIVTEKKEPSWSVRGVWERIKGTITGLFSSEEEEQPEAASWYAKIRIPELDSHIPMPTYYVEKIDTSRSKKDLQQDLWNARYIALHKTFRPQRAGMAEPAINDVVWVSVQNGKFYVTSLQDEPNRTAVGTQTGTGSMGTPKARKGTIKPTENPGTPPTPGMQLKPDPPENVDENEAKAFLKRLNEGTDVTDGIPIDVNKWKEWIHYDIITEEINGRKITLHREEMPVYRDFVTDAEATLKSLTGKELKVKHDPAETFRLVRKGGGKFFSKSATGTHPQGTAIDIRHEYLWKPLVRGKSAEARIRIKRNVISLLIQVALEKGYRGFGVGANAFHMDRRPGHMMWLYSKVKNENGVAIEDKWLAILKIHEQGTSGTVPVPDEYIAVAQSLSTSAEFYAQGPTAIAKAIAGRQFNENMFK